MTTADVEDAGEDPSRLVEMAATGDDVVISRGGVPVAKLVRLADEPLPRRRLGMRDGQITTIPSRTTCSRLSKVADAASAG